MKKGKYKVKDGYTIKHDGQKYESGAEIELTKAEAEKLNVESAEQYKARQVLEGKDTYEDSPAPNTKELVAKIETAQHPETVEVLMSLSTIKAVAAAGNKRLKVLAEASDDNSVTTEDIFNTVKAAKNNEELVALERKAVDVLDTKGMDTLMAAIAGRKKELGI